MSVCRGAMELGCGAAGAQCNLKKLPGPFILAAHLGAMPA